MTTSPRLAGLTMLVVEDEPLIALEMEAVLGDEGCIGVQICTTCADALEILASGSRPDAALVDFQLGSETATSVMTALACQSIPFVMLSANSRDQLPPGDYRLFVKPVAMEKVIAHLTAMLDRTRGEEV